nr:hypothetical protein [Tanacetum cinerariifolium]
MDHKEAKVKRKRNQKNTKRKIMGESSFEFKVTTTSSIGKKHKKNIKISDENKKNIKIHTRTTPTVLFNAMAILNVDRKNCLYEMGFGSTIGMTIHELSRMLGFYVINNLDTKTNVLSLTDNSILVTSQSVHDILIIPMGECSLESLASRSPNGPFIKEWFSQFGEKNKVRPNDISDVIVSTKDVDEGLSRFSDCKKLNKFYEKFKENTTGIDNDDTTEIGNSDLHSIKNKERNEDVHHILNEDDKVDDSCPATGVCSVIERNEVKFTEFKDVEKEKQQIGNEDDRVVDDSVTTIPDSVKEGKRVKFIENDNVLVDDVHNEMIKCSFEVQKKDSLNECDAVIQDENKAIVQDSIERSAEVAVDSQHTIKDIFKQDEQIQSAEGLEKLVSRGLEKLVNRNNNSERKVFVQYLYYVKHPKAEEIEKAKIKRMKMSLKTTCNSTDCGEKFMKLVQAFEQKTEEERKKQSMMPLLTGIIVKKYEEALNANNDE